VSRPKPIILVEKIERNHNTEQVLAAEGIWAIYYKGQPINLKSFNGVFNYDSPKYKKVAFSNSGHAINLAKKLNKKFACEDFTVMLMGKPQCVYPPE